ncbi:hypothetical protein H2203_006286 [Taxawa tesnikishii (nom. ined.)]|nr:hypothetical protein H2203_006286 [Dothideales sp. JES 119]
MQMLQEEWKEEVNLWTVREVKLDRRCETLTAAVDILRVDNDKLRQKLEQATKELEQAKRQRADINKKLEDVRNRWSFCQELLLAEEKKHLTVHNEYIAAQTEVNVLTERFRQETDELKGRLTTAESAHAAEKSTLQQQLKNVNAALDSTMQAYRKTDAEKTRYAKQVSDMQVSKEVLNWTIDTLRKNLFKVQNVAHNYSYCRNIACEDVFNIYFENIGTDDIPDMPMRCSECRCRHDA